MCGILIVGHCLRSKGSQDLVKKSVEGLFRIPEGAAAERGLGRLHKEAAPEKLRCGGTLETATQTAAAKTAPAMSPEGHVLVRSNVLMRESGGLTMLERGCLDHN